jgi:hypothetical protein
VLLLGSCCRVVGTQLLIVHFTVEKEKYKTFNNTNTVMYDKLKNIEGTVFD